MLPGRLRRLRLGGGHRLGTLAMAPALCRIISLHVVMYRARAAGPPGELGHGRAGRDRRRKKDTRAETTSGR